MGRVVALLRSVNVGGNRMTMDLLRALAAEAGCEEVRTVLATGNVVMAPPDDAVAVQHRFEALLADRVGRIDVVWRTHGELVDAVARNPYGDDVEAGDREGRFVHTMFLQSRPDEEARASLVPDDSDDVFVVSGREVFVAYDGSSQGSRYQGAWFERHLGVTGTLRNHNSVRKVIAAAAAD